MRSPAIAAVLATVTAGLAFPAAAPADQDSDTGQFSFDTCGEHQTLLFDTQPGARNVKPTSPAVGTAILDPSGRTIGQIVDVAVRKTAAGAQLAWTGQGGGTLCTEPLIVPFDSTQIRFAWTYANTPPPRLAAFAAREIGVGKPATNAYHVVIAVAARVCAQRGPVRIDITETENDQGGGQSFDHRQTRRCETFRDRWKLDTRFFGVGVYKLAARAVDRYEHHSPARTRRFVTTD
jgi:hypothetical protein